VRYSALGDHLQAQLSAITKIEEQLRRIMDTQLQMLKDCAGSSIEHQQIEDHLKSETKMMKRIQEKIEAVDSMLEVAAKKLGAIASRPENIGTCNFEESVSDCLKALFLSDPAIEKAEIENRKGQLIPDSCNWALDILDQYLHDLTLDRLWIHGDPGKGKTMIAMALVNAVSARISSIDDCTRGHLLADIDSTYEAILDAIFIGFIRGTCRFDPKESSAILDRAISSLEALLRNVSATFCPVPDDIEKELRQRASQRFEDVARAPQPGTAIPEETAENFFRQSELNTRAIILSNSERVNPLPRPFLAYFFCDSTSDQRSHMSHVLRSFLHQLLRRVLPLKSNAALKFLNNFKITGEMKGLSSVEALWIELNKVVQWAPLDAIIFMVDGLDECDESSLEIFLSLLRRAGTRKDHNDIGISRCDPKWILLSRRNGLSAQDFGPATVVVDLEQHSHTIMSWSINLSTRNSNSWRRFKAITKGYKTQ
jgi:hypothetical protein